MAIGGTIRDTFTELVGDINNETNKNSVLNVSDNSNNFPTSDNYNQSVNTANVTDDSYPSQYKRGVRSLMNEHAIYTIGNRAQNYKNNNGHLWFDEFNDIAPTAKNIIEKWNQQNPFAPYKIEDFLYSKFYGVIPNNHLITLRRFYRPVYDNLQVAVVDGEPEFREGGNSSDISKIHYPISTAVTWFGNETENNIGELMSFTCGMNWTEVSAEVDKVTGNSVGVNQSNRGGVLGAMSKAFRGASRAYALKSGDPFVNRNMFQEANKDYDPYEGPYKNRIYGPLDVIHQTYKRERGLNFSQEYSINFHYDLLSVDENDPKTVMFDILSNFLSLTFNFAEFWGGANRFFPGSLHHAPFPGGMAYIQQLYTGDIDTIIGASKNLFNDIKTTFFGTGGDAGGLLNQMNDSVNKLLSGDVEGALSTLFSGQNSSVTGIVDMLLKGIGVGDIPQLANVPALLTGEPVGEWHLCVGNPFNPTMMVGNLIVDNVEVKFNNELFYEGVPTEMTITVSMKHGRPRDSADIQSMFNKGNGRMYFYDDPSVNKSSSTQNSRIDNSWRGRYRDKTGNDFSGKFGFGNVSYPKDKD